MAALNQELSDAFGPQLVQAKDYPSVLPSIDTLRGRVLTLLSGGPDNRAEYLRDTGDNPAVAMNSHGQIVEVNDSGSGVL
jgi:hypothetical protein